MNFYIAPGSSQLFMLDDENLNSYAGSIMSLSATGSSGDIVLYVKQITE